MLVFVVLSTVALLLLMAVGQFFPTRVFLGPTATRQKVAKFYGIPAAIGFVGLMVFGPSEKPAAPAEASAASAQPAKTADAEPEAEKGRVKSVTFQGFTVPGRFAEAKATGFTDCKADYYGYKCTRAIPSELFGIKALSAQLTMDGRDHFADAYLTPVGPSGDVRELKLEQLAYGEVVLTFARADYDLKCVDKHREKNGGIDQPASCITNKNTIVHVSQALLDAGWILSRSKGGYYNHVHPAELVDVTVKDDYVTIGRVSAEHVKELVAREADRHSSKAAAESNAAKVLEQMKK